MATGESPEVNGAHKQFDHPRMNAADHSRYARHPRKIAFRLLAQNYNLVTSLGFPCTVLDAGCGTGDSSKLLSYFANVSEILALDESAEMLAVAETFNNDQRIVYDLADLGDYFRLPDSASDGFDLVCSFDTLHWMKEPLRGLAVLARSVRIGGLLIGFTLASMPKSYTTVLPMLSEVRPLVLQVNTMSYVVSPA